MSLEIAISAMKESDIDAVALIHQSVFARQKDSQKWIDCNFRAYPRIQYFVAVHQNAIIGYVEWMQKSGFRNDVVLELEQIAVDPKYQHQGVGGQLIKKSLPLVQQQLEVRGAHVKSILVTTRADNPAQQLYRETLGAEIQATIKNLYSADEVIMIAAIKKNTT